MMVSKTYEKVDKKAKEFRKDYDSKYKDLSEMPLTREQRKAVLEHIAMLFWRILNDNEYSFGHCKSYDPLTIAEGEAHSYVFDMEDGGRHHGFKNLDHLEKMIVNDFKRWIGGPPVTTQKAEDILVEEMIEYCKTDEDDIDERVDRILEAMGRQDSEQRI